VRAFLVLTAALLLLAGCGSGGGKNAGAPSDRSKQCTDRMLAGVKGDRSPLVRSYIQRTYCDRFAKNGWVYADGTLSIKAELWLDHGATCSESTPGGPTVTVPCEPDFESFECGLLHFVRKAEVQAYLAKLTRTHRVVCDDGTPLDELGAT